MGAGMRSAYSAGFLYALATELKLLPDIIIGTSGDAGNALYFASKQYSSARRVWCGFIATHRVISLWRFWKIFDVDYLVDVIFKKKEPLNVEALAASTVEWFIPLTDADTGETRYISAHDHADPFELLRAAKAIPFYFGRRVPLLGRLFIDGEVGPTLADHAQFALEKGANRLLMINNGREQRGMINYLQKMLAKLEPPNLRDSMLRDFATDQSVCFVGPAGVQVICVFPGELPAGFATVNKKALTATLDLGIEKAIALGPELRTLFT